MLGGKRTGCRNELWKIFDKILDFLALDIRLLLWEEDGALYVVSGEESAFVWRCDFKLSSENWG
jgi:hypothetical protein